jgi:hypothetical protein
MKNNTDFEPFGEDNIHFANNLYTSLRMKLFQKAEKTINSCFTDTIDNKEDLENHLHILGIKK